LRLMKMLKLLRMVRLLRAFHELRLILSSISGCVTSMFWTSILIFTISYIFGLMLMNGCTNYLKTSGADIDNETRDAIQRYWGSVGQSILSLYMSSMGGQDWELIIMPFKDVGYFFFALFLLYLGIFAFVIMNIISSIFLESILSHSDKDHELTIEKHMEHKEDYINKLQKLFDEIDDDNDGEITYSEFCACVSSPELQAFTSSLEIHVADARQFFSVISGRGKYPVDLETFVVGCIKLKGAAKSVDLMDLAYNHKKTFQEQQEMFNELHRMAIEQHEIITEQRSFDRVVLKDFERLFEYAQQIVRLETASQSSPPQICML